ncbi:hypothetical protein [Saccharothrix sp. NRRL B-16314]|uniref:hypothetical protein n=1 Tax=Saccharothrix sp. NRRL B-16314 TaxID=1463825 RepID=UPI00052442F3|nr:hypothetical protein [Saccharothrix sp. NRRL B-16314]
MRTAAVLVGLALLTSCGVTTEDDPRPLVTSTANPLPTPTLTQRPDPTTSSSSATTSPAPTVPTPATRHPARMTG